MCFLCKKSLDGWEAHDDPIEEHLRHSPTCGWAIMAAIEAGFGNYGKVHPLEPVMIEARKATFDGRWPYEGKKGFKCKTKKVSAGFPLACSLSACVPRLTGFVTAACRGRLEVHPISRG